MLRVFSIKECARSAPKRAQIQPKQCAHVVQRAVAFAHYECDPKVPVISSSSSAACTLQVSDRYPERISFHRSPNKLTDCQINILSITVRLPAYYLTSRLRCELRVATSVSQQCYRRPSLLAIVQYYRRHYCCRNVSLRGRLDSTRLDSNQTTT